MVGNVDEIIAGEERVNPDLKLYVRGKLMNNGKTEVCGIIIRPGLKIEMISS